jgi:hypothetical protein
MSPHLKECRGVPLLSGGSKKISTFDEIAKPKYNCHHYMHDPKFEFNINKTSVGLAPFNSQTGKTGKTASNEIPKLNFIEVRDFQKKQLENFPYRRYNKEF